MIAVIGLSGRYPGQAATPDQLWSVLRDGIDVVSDLPEHRLDVGYLNPDREAPNRSYCMRGGYLPAIDLFDAAFFGMSPREARQVDPQQRLLLELAWEAVESAAIDPKRLAGSQTGVYVGISNHDYGDLWGPIPTDAYSNTGSALSIAANRISYVLDLHGPSLSIDTACSSGLVALHQACQALRDGACDLALAGAANILAHPRPWIGFAKASMLSPEGRCRSFDASGAGYVRAEGGGMLVLKRLDRAERDGDPVLGVLIGSGVNSDGRTMGLSLPNVNAQAVLLQQVYGACGLAAEDVFYVEAHGTGTAVGDPIECEAIGRVLGAPRRDGSVLHIGSVKSNIGHLEPAAGLAGITKLLLALRHGEIPAQLHFRAPNPAIDFDGWRLRVVDRALALPRTYAPLRFGINSFGFGGTNAHAVLQQYRPSPARTVVPAAAVDRGPDLLLLCAQNAAALADMAGTYADWLRANAPVPWRDVCATAALCRARLPQRLALLASSGAEAAGKLDAFRAGDSVSGLAAERVAVEAPRVAFVYAGNGPQWWAMGRALMADQPRFRAAVEGVDALFQAREGWSLVEELHQPEARSRMARTDVAQPTLFALQVGLTTLLRQAGVEADMVFGHSVGEVAAAWASGALTLEQATDVIVHRSAMQAKTAGQGRMAALGLSADEARAAIAAIDGWLELAAINGPRAVTVAGDAHAIERLRARVTESGKFARVLALDYAFHSRAMDPIEAELRQRLAHLRPSEHAIPFLSTVEGEALAGSALGATYWWRNVRRPVLFRAAVDRALQHLGATVFVEIGPHPVLRDYVTQSAKALDRAVSIVATLRRPAEGRPEVDADNVAVALCTLHALGAGDVRSLYDRPARPVALPTYPWQRARHWRGMAPLPDARVPVAREHELLGWRVPDTEALWQNALDLTLLPYLADHVVQDSVLFPMAGHIELGLSAAIRLLGADPVGFENLDILRPLVVTDRPIAQIQVGVDPADGTCEIRSRGDANAEGWTAHARMRLTKSGGAPPPPLDLARLRAGLPDRIDAASHYALSASRGMVYGPRFQGVRALHLSAPGAGRSEAVAEIEIAEPSDGYRGHPAVLDSALQALITLLGRGESRPVAYIPTRIERVRSFAPLPSRVQCHVVVRRESDRSGSADFTLCDADGAVLLCLEGARFRKVEFHAGDEAPLVTEAWRPDPTTPARALPVSLPSPAAKLPLAPEVAAADQDVSRSIDRLIGAYAVEALLALGAAGQGVHVARWQRSSRLAPSQARLLQAVLSWAESDGYLRRDGSTMTWCDDAPSPDAAARWRALFLAHPTYAAELILAARHGERLARTLRDGAPEPDDRGDAPLEQLHESAPSTAPMRHAVRGAIAAMMRDWPADRPVRIIELCGGTGGLAASVLPLLPAARADYVFGDRSAAALERAKQRFAHYPFLRTVALAPDQPLVGISGPFDLVIAVPPRHASIEPADLISRGHALLAPGGWLILGTPGTARLDILLRGGAQAAPADDQFVAAGFDQIARAAGLVFARRSPLQAVPSTRTTGADARTFRLLAGPGEAEFAASLSGALRLRGQSVDIHRLETAADAPGVLRLAADEIVHLAGLAPVPPAGAEAMLAQQDLRVLTATLLVQAIKSAAAVKPVLRFVTRGAFAGPTRAGPLDPAQAPLWGFGRVLANEHPDLAPRLIDLHADLDAQAADLLADELLRLDDEVEVLLAAGQRFVNRVRSSTDLQLAAEAQSGDAAPHRPFRLVAAGPGGIDALRTRAISRVPPGPGRVELRVSAAGLNYRDVLWTMGLLPEEAVEQGFAGATIGMECAGEVVAVGDGVTHVRPGDRVLAFASSTFASHVTTDAGAVLRVPDGISDTEAATIPTAFLTAWHALHYLARLQPGERVLIHGAAGGVGLAAVQIAKLRGADVFGTAGSDEKRRVLRLLGVDHVLDSRSLAFADDIRRLTGGEGIDVVLNSLAGEAITEGLSLLKPFGRFIEIGKRDLYANSRIGLRPFRNNLSYFGVDADTLLVERAALARDLFAEVIALFAQGRLRPLPHTTFPITRAAEAFRLMQQSRHIGKIVLTMDDGPAPVPAVADRPTLPRDGTYLVTGGLGGFGLATARWLVARGAGAVTLIGRRGAVTEEARAGIAEIEAMGGKVLALAADVTSKDEVAAVLARIKAGLPPLRGVVHAAAAFDDTVIAKLDGARLRHVLAAKIVGAWNLHEATLRYDLDHFVLYSSGTTVIGNPGQANYVAANLYLESLAQYRRARGLPALAVAWGAIKDVGVLARRAGVEDMLRNRTGMSAVPAEQALATRGRLMALGAARVSVAGFDVHRLGSVLPSTRAPRFEALAGNRVAASRAQPAETLAGRLRDRPSDERAGLVLERTREHIGRVLGTGPGQVDPERSLQDMGLDSLMAVELAEALEHDVGQPVAVMQIIQAGSVNAVAAAILAMIDRVDTASVSIAAE